MNFRSINKEVSLNLSASADRQFEENLVTFENKKYLKSVEIYGPNGSGKSTLLKALVLMAEMVCNSRDNKPGIPLSRYPHRLNAAAPTRFSLWFERKGIKYFYEFSYTDEKILEEYLYYSPDGKLVQVFDRTDMAMEFGSAFAKDSGNCDKELKPNKLLLSVSASITNIEPVLQAYLFFQNDLVFSGKRQVNWTEFSAKKLQDDMNTKEKFVEFLKAICPGLQGMEVSVENKDPSDAYFPDGTPEEIKRFMLTQGMRVVLDIRFNYGDFSLKLAEESDGVKVLFDILPVLLDVISNNKVYVCDEFETHLHPAIVKRLLLFFFTNTDSSSQMLFTTHNVELLDLDFVRRDQIWFTELTGEGRETELYSLAEMKGVGCEENIHKGYLDGRYGALPPEGGF